MPTLVWLYLTALLYYRTSVKCVALAEALGNCLPRPFDATAAGRLVRAKTP